MFFLRLKNNGLFLVVLPLLLLPMLLRKNLINGGGNLSVLPGLDMGFEVNDNLISFFKFSLLFLILVCSLFFCVFIHFE